MRTASCLILLGVGSLAVLSGHFELAHWRESLRHESISLPVDLSSVGNYEGILDQKYRPTHGKQFRFVVQPPFPSQQEALRALANLRAHLKITRENGDVVLTHDLTVEDFREDHCPGCKWHAPLAPSTPYVFVPAFPTDWEPCALVFTVDEAADGFAGREQRLVTRNVWCSMSKMEVCSGWAKVTLGVFLLACGVMTLRPSLWTPVSVPRADSANMKTPLGCVIVSLGALILLFGLVFACSAFGHFSRLHARPSVRADHLITIVIHTVLLVGIGAALVSAGCLIRNHCGGVLGQPKHVRASRAKSDLDAALVSCADLVSTEHPKDLYAYDNCSTSELIRAFHSIDPEQDSSRYAALLWVMKERRDNWAAALNGG